MYEVFLLIRQGNVSRDEAAVAAEIGGRYRLRRWGFQGLRRILAAGRDGCTGRGQGRETESQRPAKEAGGLTLVLARIR